MSYQPTLRRICHRVPIPYPTNEKASGDRSDKTEGQDKSLGSRNRSNIDTWFFGRCVAHGRKVSAHQFDPGSPLRVWGLDPRYLTCPLIPVSLNSEVRTADSADFADYRIRGRVFAMFRNRPRPRPRARPRFFLLLKSDCEAKQQ